MITVSWLKHLSGPVVRVLLDYVDHVTLCSKLKAAVMERQQWPDICRLQGDWSEQWSSDSRHNRALAFNLSPLSSPPSPSSRERPLSAASLSSADPPLSRPPPSPVARLHELPAVARETEGLRPVSGVRPVRPAGRRTGVTEE